MPFYLRYERSWYLSTDVPGDGRCLFHALGQEDGGVDGAIYMKRALASMVRPIDSRLSTVLSVFGILKQLGRFDGDVLNKVVGLRNQLLDDRDDWRNWGTDEHALLYSIMTGNRVVCYCLTRDGTAKVYDTLDVWNQVRNHCVLCGIPIPAVGMNVTSHTRYIYFHKHLSPTSCDISTFNHFSRLELKWIVPFAQDITGMDDYYVDTILEKEVFGKVERRRKGSPKYDVRRFDKGRTCREAPGGRSMRGLNLAGRERRERCSKGDLLFLNERYNRLAKLIEVEEAVFGANASEEFEGRDDETSLCNKDDSGGGNDNASLCENDNKGRDMKHDSGLLDCRKRGSGLGYTGSRKRYRVSEVKVDLLPEEVKMMVYKGESQSKYYKANRKKILEKISSRRKAKKEREKRQDHDKEGFVKLENDVCGVEKSGFLCTADELKDAIVRERECGEVFLDITKKPSKAVLLHYLNSGLFGFERWKEYTKGFGGKLMSDEDKDGLVKEVLDEQLTDEELKVMLKKFFKCHSYVEERLPSCGACGIRMWERSESPEIVFKRLQLTSDSVAGPLQYTVEEENDFRCEVRDDMEMLCIPVDDKGGTKEVEAWRARSVYEDKMGLHWHLHPELVDRDSDTGCESTLVCPECYKNLRTDKRPKLSVSSGLDFGHYSRLGLTMPNLHEQLILSRTRLFFAAVKYTSNRKGQRNFNVRNKMKCHAILFPCREAETVPLMTNWDIFGDGGILDRESLKGLFSVYCIDDKTNPDQLMRLVHGSDEIVGRPWVLAQWILVLQKLNRYYSDIDVSNTVDFVEQIKNRMQKVYDDLADKARIINDPAAIHHEETLGSDVAENQQTGEGVDDIDDENEMETGQSIRYSYVTTTDQGWYIENGKDCRMKAMADMVDLNHLRKELAEAEKESCDISNMAYVEREFESNRSDDDSSGVGTRGEFSCIDLDENCASGDEDGFGGGSASDVGCVGGKEDTTAIGGLGSREYNTEKGEWYSDKNGDFSGFEGGEGSFSNLDCCPEGEEEQREELPTWDDPEPVQGKTCASAKSGRVSEPNSSFGDEFDHQQEISTTFPHVFMLGRAYDRYPGRLSREMRRHLLHQFTLTPARDRRLLAYLFDKKQRIDVMDGVKAYVNGSKNSLDAIGNLLKDENERKKLKEACEKPKKEGNWDLIKKYMPHLRFASKDVSYGAAEGAKFQWRAMEMNKRYSCPNCFLTISPTTLDNPRGIRMAFRTVDNKSFPAIFEDGCSYGNDSEDFIKKLRENSTVVSEGQIDLPKGCVTKASRAGIAMNNPVAFVQENKALLNDILNILLGFNIEDESFFGKTEGDSSRKTKFYKSKKGIFGHPLYAIGVTEDHQRGTLHWHISLLAGITPHALQSFSRLDRVCDSISKVLDTMYTSDVPENAHVANLLRQSLKHHQKEVEWNISKEVIDSISAREQLLFVENREALADYISEKSGGRKTFGEKFRRVATLLGSYAQHHRHYATCHKTLRGEEGCRFDFPCGICEETRGIGLVPKKPTLISEVTGNRSYCVECGGSEKGSYVVMDRDVEKNYRYAEQDILKYDLVDEMTVWETKHPTIVPTILPLPEAGKIPSIDELRGAFKKAVRDLPEFGYPFGGAFAMWLNHKATAHQIVQIWREIIKELPGANRMVPAFNPVLSYCTGSHNNASLLGGLDQAKSALFYLVPYQGKSKFPIQEALPVLNDALDYVDKHDSKHPTEAGTLQRTVKHLLTRTINKMHLRMEISDYEMAAALLELPSVIATDRFVVGNPEALASVKVRLHCETSDNSQESVLGRLSSRIEEARVSKNRKEEGSVFPVFEDENDNAGEEYERRKDFLSEIGFIRKVRLTNDNGRDSMLIPEVSFYLYRSEDLEELNYYEFLSCVETREVKNGGGVGRQKRFTLIPTIDGCMSMYQVLLRKQKTPLFVGIPPRHPGRKPDFQDTSDENRSLISEWVRRSNDYARYFLMLFRPFRVEDDESQYTWDVLEEWIDQLKADSSIISKFRLMTMHQHMRGMRTREVCRKMAREYRARNRKIWNNKEQYDYKERERRKRGYVSILDACVLDDYYTGGGEELSELQNRNMVRQLKHELEQRIQMERVFGGGKYQSVDGKALGTGKTEDKTTKRVPVVMLGRKDVSKNRILCTSKESTIVQSIEQLQNFKRTTRRVPTVVDTSDYGERRLARNRIVSLRKKLSKFDSSTGKVTNTQQLELFDLYSGYFLRNKNAKKPPQIVLCHGGPGVGKSVIRKAIDDAAQACGVFCLKTSFNAINAIEMGGRTTASVLKLNARHRNYTGNFKYSRGTGDMIEDLRMEGFNRSSLVIVEEVSNQAPWHLARLDRLCREAAGNDEDFGGALVLLIGDLTQLGPVKAIDLSCGVMDINLDKDLRRRIGKRKLEALGKVSLEKGDRPEEDKYKRNHPHRIGSDLLIRARWFELTQQQRSEDDRHTELVIGNYRGERLSLEKIKGKYEILTKESSKGDDWIKAPILVSTNRERQTLTHTRSIHFAKREGTVVVRWKTNCVSWKQQPLLKKHRLQALEDPCFYEYFVQGAEAFLTENIQKDLKLTNATSVVYNSLVLEPRTRREFEKKLHSAEPGDVITLSESPLAVNVEVQLCSEMLSDDVKRCFEDHQVAQAKFTRKVRNHTTYVLPIWEYGSAKVDSSETTVRGGVGFLPSKARLKKVFPIEPAFAITVHKSEGRTLGKVIIALSSCSARGCDFSFAQVHVAFSRVRKAKDIRLLLTGNRESDQWRSILYLANLKPKASIQYFFDGFRTIEDYDNPNVGWMDNVWSAERANNEYRKREGL